ncbi:MAG: tetratricopeptide repeat protein [Opitutales bacterium]|nr:tetratricopeptide repeat protein [Opitutales bacterium]
MKKITILFGLLGTAVALSAISRQEVLEVYRSPQWERAFAGTYGIDSGVEPELDRQDRAIMELLPKIRENVQRASEAEAEGRSGDQHLRAVVEEAEAYIRRKRNEGQQPSANILQIAGNVSMRLAENASGGEQRRWQDRALEYFRQAVEVFPNFRRVHTNMGHIYFRMENRREDAKRHFVRAVELGLNDAIVFGLLGYIYFEEGRYTSAENAVRNSLMLNPGSFEFRQILAQLLFNQERYHEAQSALTELLYERPNSSDLWNLQANTFIATDRIDQATQNLEMVRMMGVADSQSLRLLGDVYMNRNIVEDAAEAYREAIEAARDLTLYQSFIGAVRTLINFSGYDEAIAVIDTLEGRFEDDLSEEQEIELLTLRSQVNVVMGRGEEAIDNLEAVLRRDPFNAGALIALGQYYSDRTPDLDLDEEQQQVQERRFQNQAILYFERAQDVDDIDQQVRAYVSHARLRVRRQELDEAIRLLESAQGLRRQEHIESYLNQIRQAVRARRARS